MCLYQITVCKHGLTLPVAVVIKHVMSVCMIRYRLYLLPEPDRELYEHECGEVIHELRFNRLLNYLLN
jgi:hypothetical protein